MTAGPRNIAIVGGGPSGLVAAWELANRLPTGSKITVYQMGWRLGGKLSTDRNPDVHRRIEEHGIHILFGAYENAFHVIQEAAGANWKTLFAEHGHTTLMERVDGEWQPWSIDFPRRAQDPGYNLANEIPSPSMLESTHDLLKWLAEYAKAHTNSWAVEWLIGKWLQASLDILATLPNPIPLPSHVTQIENLLGMVLKLLRFGRRVGDFFAPILGFFGFAVSAGIHRRRRLWILANLASAAVVGLLRAAAFGQNTEDLDGQDLREWLDASSPLGGIDEESLDSAPMRMVYEVVFAYDEGDDTKPSLAAGTAARALLRLLLDYRGAFVYEMKAGSEAIVTTLYEALKSKGVRFEFFHRLESVVLSADRSEVERLVFARQATPIGPTYDPTDGNGGWPDHPNYDQLVEGAILKTGYELASSGYDLESQDTASTVSFPAAVAKKSGTNPDGFDDVILATSVGALEHSNIALQLSGKTDLDPTSAQQKFNSMLENSKAIATQSSQLWFTKTATEMGWHFDGDLVGAFAQPFGNWADLSLTIPEEGWPPGLGVKQVAYLAGPLKTPDTVIYAPHQWRAEVAQRVQDWLEGEAKALWPNAYTGTGFRWDWLVDPGNRTGTLRMGAQWFRANCNAGELYTLTLPGSTKHRLGPESGFAHLYLAGDWTRCTFNVGAMEAAVMSGRMAARAILGDSFPIYAEK